MRRGDWHIYHLPGLDPIPWKAPEGFIGRRSGSMFVGHHADPSCTGFKEAVAEDFPVHNPNFRTFPFEDIDLIFWLWRNTEGHNVADATNCQKLLEDSLQRILFTNDRQVQSVTTHWMEQGPKAEPYIMIGIRRHVVPAPPPRREFAPAPRSLAGEHDVGEDPF